MDRMDTAIILLEFVLSIIFISIGYIVDKIYFSGTGVGLTIVWVTGAIANLYRKKKCAWVWKLSTAGISSIKPCL